MTIHPKGMPVLYCSLKATTAIKEANQAGTLQPTTLVSYDADIERVFDTRDEAALEPFGMSAAGLAAASWRDQMKADGKAPTQLFAETLVGRGYHGFLVSSYAPGATDDDLKLSYGTAEVRLHPASTSSTTKAVWGPGA